MSERRPVEDRSTADLKLMLFSLLERLEAQLGDLEVLGAELRRRNAELTIGDADDEQMAR